LATTEKVGRKEGREQRRKGSWRGPIKSVNDDKHHSNQSPNGNLGNHQKGSRGDQREGAEEEIIEKASGRRREQRKKGSKSLAQSKV
jgi:hypothetical protein